MGRISKVSICCTQINKYFFLFVHSSDQIAHSCLIGCITKRYICNRNDEI